MIAKTIWASIFVMLITFANAEYDVAKYCKLVQPDTKLPSLSSCKTYYICQGMNEPIQAQCPGANVFNKDIQGCIPETNSNCYYDAANPCRNKDKQFAGSTKGCNWYNWCVNGKIYSSGTCEIGQIFNAARGTCVPGRCGSEKADEPNLCEIMPDGVFFGDFKDCSGWHRCNGMSLKSSKCSNSLVFDTNNGMCLENDGKMCQRTNNVVKPQASGPPQYACDNINQRVGDTNVCSIYYTCRIATQIPTTTYEWVTKSCGYQYFDVITKQCNGTLLARSFPGCDRCEFKTGSPGHPYWVNAVDPTCSQYLTCNSGHKVATGSCGLEGFFKEEAQVCIEGDNTLSTYKTKNGACQNYNCNDKRECSFVGENDNTSSPTESPENKTSSPTESSETKTKTETVKPDKE